MDKDNMLCKNHCLKGKLFFVKRYIWAFGYCILWQEFKMSNAHRVFVQEYSPQKTYLFIVFVVYFTALLDIFGMHFLLVVLFQTFSLVGGEYVTYTIHICPHMYTMWNIPTFSWFFSAFFHGKSKNNAEKTKEQKANIIPGWNQKMFLLSLILFWFWFLQVKTVCPNTQFFFRLFFGVFMNNQNLAIFFSSHSQLCRARHIVTKDKGSSAVSLSALSLKFLLVFFMTRNGHKKTRTSFIHVLFLVLEFLVYKFWFFGCAW